VKKNFPLIWMNWIAMKIKTKQLQLPINSQVLILRAMHQKWITQHTMGYEVAVGKNLVAHTVPESEPAWKIKYGVDD